MELHIFKQYNRDVPYVKPVPEFHSTSFPGFSPTGPLYTVLFLNERDMYDFDTIRFLGPVFLCSGFK